VGQTVYLVILTYFLSIVDLEAVNFLPLSFIDIIPITNQLQIIAFNLSHY